MSAFEDNLKQVIQHSLEKSPEEMLEECLRILIKTSGATGGSILGEEGAALKFLFSNVPELIGLPVPWDSLAGSAARNSVIIYTHAPTDKRHYDGISEEIVDKTDYLLSIPIPSVHQKSDEDSSRSAGVVQLLFSEDIFPDFDVASGAKEIGLQELRDQDSYADSFEEVMWILPNISLGMEIMKLRQMSYQCIHELKNKLISATSWVNCLKEDLEDLAGEALEDEDIQEDFDLALSSLHEGSNLAKSYLQFTGIYNPVFAPTNVNLVLKDTAGSIAALAQDFGATNFQVVRDFADDLPQNEYDASQLKMAFFNLGKNGTEALIEHGVENPTITLTSRLENGNVVVTIRDNGNGMPQEIADNLFVAFKTKKKGGTGLGLTITKKIVDVHSGTIRCETGESGTSFTITL
jgi:signal transduction histidine kinase